MVLTKDELKGLLQNEVRILLHLAGKIDRNKLDYRPTAKQRSTLELLQYLVTMGPILLRAIKAGAFDQAAFQAAWPAIGSDGTAPSGLLSTAQASSPTHSIQGPGTLANNQYRNRKTFAETSTLSSSGNLGIGDQLIWSFDFYDSNSGASPARNF